MKKHWMHGVAILAAGGLLAVATAAQQGSSGQRAPQPGMMYGHMGMMQGGMGTTGAMPNRMGSNYMGGMHGMMMAGLQSPVGRSAMMAFLLPGMKKELGLSTSQTQQLEQMRQQFISQEQKTSNDIVAARKQLNTLFSSGAATDEQVRKAVDEITNLQGQRLINGYETAKNMKAVLTPDQRNKLESMSPTELRNAMMSYMTMNQMSQMMRYMYGVRGAGMMRGGMMGMMGGMMQNGAMPYGMMQGQASRQR